MAKVFSNILLFAYLTLGLGAFLVFAPDWALTWFRAIDDILSAGLFTVLAGLSLVAATFVNAAVNEEDLDAPIMEPEALSAQNLRNAFRYFFLGVLLAFTLDPMIETTALVVTEDIPQALMDNLEDDVSMFDVWLSSMVIWAYTWLTTIWANVFIFLELALGLVAFKCGFAFLCAGAEALTVTDDPSVMTRFTDWMRGRKDSDS
jgi:hypothetical protein